MQTATDLAKWASRLRAAELNEAFVFFKHEDEGAGPRMAAEFIAVCERGQRRRGAKASKVAKSDAEEREAG